MRQAYLLLCFALLTTTPLSGLESPEDPSAQLAAEACPSGLVAGCVDINTGGFVLRDNDVQGSGPDPFCFSRVYSSNVIQK